MQSASWTHQWGRTKDRAFLAPAVVVATRAAISTEIANVMAVRYRRIEPPARGHGASPCRLGDSSEPHTGGEELPVTGYRPHTGGRATDCACRVRTRPRVAAVQPTLQADPAGTARRSAVRRRRARSRRRASRPGRRAPGSRRSRAGARRRFGRASARQLELRVAAELGGVRLELEQEPCDPGTDGSASPSPDRRARRRVRRGPRASGSRRSHESGAPAAVHRPDDAAGASRRATGRSPRALRCARSRSGRRRP